MYRDGTDENLGHKKSDKQQIKVPSLKTQNLKAQSFGREDHENNQAQHQAKKHKRRP
jgi:hypothetical protein